MITAGGPTMAREFRTRVAALMSHAAARLSGYDVKLDSQTWLFFLKKFADVGTHPPPSPQLCRNAFS